MKITTSAGIVLAAVKATKLAEEVERLMDAIQDAEVAYEEGTELMSLSLERLEEAVKSLARHELIS